MDRVLLSSFTGKRIRAIYNLVCDGYIVIVFEFDDGATMQVSTEYIYDENGNYLTNDVNYRP